MYRVPDTRNSTAISKTCLPKSLVSAVSAPAIEPNEPISPPCLCSKKFRAWPEVRRLVRSLRGEHAVWSRSSPPPTLCSCTENETLAIAPQSQRHVYRSLWLAQSLLLQSSRMSPFRRPVSAAENSVPGPTFGDWFDPCVGSTQFGPDRLHHPVFPNRGNGRPSQRGPF